VDQAVKAEIKNEFKRSEQDTGSADVQVALLTARIKELTEHLKIHSVSNRLFGCNKSLFVRKPFISKGLASFLKRATRDGWRKSGGMS